MYLHEQGIIHCDLACRNFLVTVGSDGEKFLVNVNDFGLSKIIASNSDLYTKKDSEALPVKWSSPGKKFQIENKTNFCRGFEIWNVFLFF